MLPFPIDALHTQIGCSYFLFIELQNNSHKSVEEDQKVCMLGASFRREPDSKREEGVSKTVKNFKKNGTLVSKHILIPLGK